MPAIGPEILDRITRNHGAAIKPCADCSSSTFTLHDELVALPQVGIEAANGPASVALICEKCGLMRFYGAKQLGIG